MGKAAAGLFIGPGAGEYATRKAIHGHRTWLLWQAGEPHAGPLNPANLRRAMLSHGTQGRFLLIHKNCGTEVICDWPTAVNMLHQMKQPHR